MTEPSYDEDHCARPVRSEPARSKPRWTSDLGIEASLVDRCRMTIVQNLERYPPELFGMLLDEEEWEHLVDLRHRKTAPKEGTGGLDGTGRVAPAISSKFLRQVEQAGPTLAESQNVDQWVWKDCVEYKFKRGGLTRPRTLLLPWPILVEQMQDTGKTLIHLLSTESLTDETRKTLETSIHSLQTSPMNVALLSDSQIGKTVKKFNKACTKNAHLYELMTVQSGPKPSFLQRLEQILQSWMDMAANSGVKMDSASKKHKHTMEQQEEHEDLRLAQSCRSWRELFLALEQREERRRSNQGARMRQIRQNLASDRPKVVAVRPTSAKRQAILDRAAERKKAAYSSAARAAGNTKMLQLKREAHVGATLQKASPSLDTKKRSGFGAAVAFAAMKGVKRKSGPASTTLALGKGKRMKVPELARPTSAVARSVMPMKTKLNKPRPKR